MFEKHHRFHEGSPGGDESAATRGLQRLLAGDPLTLGPGELDTCRDVSGSEEGRVGPPQGITKRLLPGASSRNHPREMNYLCFAFFPQSS